MPHSLLQPQSLIKQRFEIKYLISEMLAQQLIDFLSTYMDPDPLGRLYPVTSLYLDNEAMSMFWSSEMGEMNRYKLRLRSYADDESFQAFAEVKRRVNRVILKSRVAIHKEQITSLLDGKGLAENILMTPNDPESIKDLQFFRDLLTKFQARPCTTVRYQREAYIGRNGEYVRITFDRDLACTASTQYNHSIWDAQAFWHTLPQVPVILEIKFTDHYPQWVHHMIQRFDLQRSSMAKYVQCVNTLQREGISVRPDPAGLIL